jgi:hypothetical protein
VSLRRNEGRTLLVPLFGNLALFGSFSTSLQATASFTSFHLLLIKAIAPQTHWFTTTINMTTISRRQHQQKFRDVHDELGHVLNARDARQQEQEVRLDNWTLRLFELRRHFVLNQC